MEIWVRIMLQVVTRHRLTTDHRGQLVEDEHLITAVCHCDMPPPLLGRGVTEEADGQVFRTWIRISETSPTQRVQEVIIMLGMLETRRIPESSQSQSSINGSLLGRRCRILHGTALGVAAKVQRFHDLHFSSLRGVAN